MTDAYYERLRSVDPKRVDELTTRARTLRTPDPTAALRGTAGDGAAATTDEPTSRHSAGTRSRYLREIQHPYLKESA